MRFLTFPQAKSFLTGRSVAIVGSAPCVLQNAPGLVDSHEVVVRVNNYKTSEAAGWRADVFYSFFGTSIKKDARELAKDGVKLCWAKCPDAHAIESEWHMRYGKQAGIDFRYIYRNRRSWWFCDTFIPPVDHFMRSFEMLERHVPTTGFAAILDVLACDPQHVYVTGFDFFTSGVHNVNEKWRPGHPDDPIGHRPEMERAWIKRNAGSYPIAFDQRLQELLA